MSAVPKEINGHSAATPQEADPVIQQETRGHDAPPVAEPEETDE